MTDDGAKHTHLSGCLSVSDNLEEKRFSTIERPDIFIRLA